MRMSPCSMQLLPSSLPSCVNHDGPGSSGSVRGSSPSDTFSQPSTVRTRVGFYFPQGRGNMQRPQAVCFLPRHISNACEVPELAKQECDARTVPKLWHELFTAPYQLWDKTFVEKMPRFSDFADNTNKAAPQIHCWLDLSSEETGPVTLKQGNDELLGSFESSGSLRNLCEEGSFRDALKAVNVIYQHGMHVSASIFCILLQRCIANEDLAAGWEVYGLIIRSGLWLETVLGSHLIHIFALCGCLLEAKQVFNKLPEPTVFTWREIISAHVKLGQADQAINLYHQMRQSSMEPDGHIFVAVLKACGYAAALTQGKVIHNHIIESKFLCDPFVESSLIDMYIRCGSLKDARRVFDELPKQDVVSWSTLMSGYAQHEDGQEVVLLFREMQQQGMSPNHYTFVSILKACSSIAALDQGKVIHAFIIESGFESNLFVGNTLIDMYAKCGSLEDACRMFGVLSKQDVVTYSAMIAGYVLHEHGQEAIKLFQQMEKEGRKPDKITFISTLKACSIIAALAQGKLIHTRIIECGFGCDLYVGNTLISMYADCGNHKDARSVFERLPKRDVVTWSAMLAGYIQNDCVEEALGLFQHMQEEGLEPNQVTFANILKACSSVSALEQGRLVHTEVIRSGFESDAYIGSTLIDLYAKCGVLQDACRVFQKLSARTVVIWSAMIAAYAERKDYRFALQYFKGMQQEGVKPDGVTFICLLSACIHVDLIDEGCQHFRSMRENHGITPTVDHYNCICDLFGHAGLLFVAEDLLETIHYGSNIVGWTTLLSHCKTHGNVELGRRCFDHVVMMDCRCAAGYMIMGSIYVAANMREDAENVEEIRKSANAWKKPGMAFIEIDKKVHSFVVGNRNHPQSEDIYGKLKKLSVKMKEGGYRPHLDIYQPSLADEDKEEALCGHCEKLAIAFGLISTPRGTSLRVSKNLRVCTDCHSAAKIISQIERREIVIRDAYCIHHFKCGTCSCKDYT